MLARALLALVLLSCAASAQGSDFLELLKPDRVSIWYGETSMGGHCGGDGSTRGLELGWDLWVPEPPAATAPYREPYREPARPPEAHQEQEKRCDATASSGAAPTKPTGAPRVPWPDSDGDPLLPLAGQWGVPGIVLYLLGRDLVVPAAKRRRARVRARLA